MEFHPGKNTPVFLATCLYVSVQKSNAERITRDGLNISDLDCTWPAVTVPRDLLETFSNGSFEFRSDVRAWLDDVPEDAYRFAPEIGAIGFSDPDDAIAFRMRWL